MSGKYEKKSTMKGGILVALIALVCVLVVVLLISGQTEPAPPAHTNAPETPESAPPAHATAPETTEPASPAHTNAPETTEPAPPANTNAPETTEPQSSTTETTKPASIPTEPLGVDLGSGVLITECVSYSGTFLEDRTDEMVFDVLAIRVTNTGEEYIQTMDIILSDGTTQANFSLSTLFPGETVIVPEMSRMPFDDAPEFTEVATKSVALFEESPGMCDDRLEIQCLNGVMNVTNISGEDITEDIFIYYKKYVDGVYYGGITYRVRLSGGLKAGEIRQGSAAHFDRENSRIVFVTCG